VAGGVPVETRFAQVAPERPEPMVARSVGQGRAVVLIHGLRPHPFNEGDVHRALFHSWQKPGSRLVRALARDADVFAFAYAENATVGQLASLPTLAEAVRRLQASGYQDIVFVGHSAGGLIARAFVEDHPNAGVTKVIQVCAPNTGSSWAKLHQVVVRGQEEFVRSLTKEERSRELRRRADKLIPLGVQFVCVVGIGEVLGDGLVSYTSQWPEDLQAQGVAAVMVFATHLLVLRTTTGVTCVASLVRENVPRWDPSRVAALRRKLLLRPESHFSTVDRTHP
jgi:pimeloyl-ACP methyl ester carboxylesterase